MGLRTWGEHRGLRTRIKASSESVKSLNTYLLKRFAMS